MKFPRITTAIITVLSLSQSAFAVDVDELLTRPGEAIGPPLPGEAASDREALIRELQEKYPELENVGNLPDVSVEGLVTTAIKTVLAWTMLLALISIVMAGIYYLKSEGEEEQITKAKSIMVYLIVGMAIMAAAYGIVTGLAQFQFFR